MRGQPLPRARAYRIYYDTSKYSWRGPPLRAILKLVAPHQPLKLSADDMYFMTPEEVAPLLNSAYFCFFLFCCEFLDANAGWQNKIMFFFSEKRWAAKEKECGVRGSFSPHLPSSAGDFKSLYECFFRDRMVFVPWQEISFFLISKDMFPLWVR